MDKNITLKSLKEFKQYLSENPLPDNQYTFIHELGIRKLAKLGDNGVTILESQLYENHHDIYKKRFGDNLGMAIIFFKMAFPDDKDYKEKVLLYLTKN